MLFRNIKIIDYPGFSRIDLEFDSKSNILFITSESYDEQLDDIISEIFMLFLILPNPTLYEYLNKNLKDFITTFCIEFSYEEKEYCYYLQLSKKGVHTEELYENNNITYQNKTLNDNPFLPEPLRMFLNRLIIIDLTRELWLRDLISEGINKCNLESEYADIVCTLFKNFNIIEDSNDVRFTGDCVYIYGRNIYDCSYSIRAVFGLIPLFIECIGSSNIMFLHGFDIEIDMKSKFKLLNLFIDEKINTVQSQLIFSDQTNYNEYNLVVDKDSKHLLSKNEDKNYVIKRFTNL